MEDVHSARGTAVVFETVPLAQYSLSERTRVTFIMQTLQLTIYLSVNLVTTPAPPPSSLLWLVLGVALQISLSLAAPRGVQQ